MGSSTSKLKKYLQHGDEFAAMQVFQNTPELQVNLDPDGSYGESCGNNTPLHYAAKHGMKHLLRTFLHDLRGNPNFKNNFDETSVHCCCQLEPGKCLSEERKASCLLMILQWRGHVQFNGEKARAQLNSQDVKGNTPLHYAAITGQYKCVELLVTHGAGLFIENKHHYKPCDLAIRESYHNVALFLEARMVFADTSDLVNELHNPNEENKESESDCELYSGLRPQDLQDAKDQLLVDTADMLRIPLFSAEALLRDNEWSKTLLLEKWMKDSVNCCEMAGIIPPASALQFVTPSTHSETPSLDSMITSLVLSEEQNNSCLESFPEKVTCLICYGEVLSWECARGISCDHKFCLSCWELYLTTKIQEGEAYHILCPAVECNMLVDVDFIEKTVSPEVARKYLQFDIQAFVETNKSLKWCPMPGCGRAVMFSEDELNAYLQFQRAQQGQPKISHAVDCGNGHFFCWECLGEAHSPCDCEHWLEWQNKISEIKPEDLKVSCEETNEAANVLWMVTNSKSCPNCKSPIQKNEGCNHLICSKCKFEFCWMCLESWKKHSSVTGGYIRCNRFEAQSKADDRQGAMLSEASARNQLMRERNRFAHYYTHFKKHQDLLKVEEPFLQTSKHKMKILAAALPSQEKKNSVLIEKGTRFVQESIKELIKSRRVLCSSYIYGYYADDSSYNRTLFEYLQNELEEIAEKLSEMIARPYLTTPRGQIMATMLLTRRRRHKFIKSLAKGFLPSESPPLIHKRRKKLPDVVSFAASNNFEGDRLSRPSSFGKSSPFSWLDSDDEEERINQTLKCLLLRKCSKKNCQRPKGQNPLTGAVQDDCSLLCSLHDAHMSGNSQTDGSTLWDSCESNMEMLIALEMSRLQMIEDEARRWQTWLQERHMEGISGAAASGEASGGSDSLWLWKDGIACPPSSAEIAVDYFMKKLANNEINLRNTNIERNISNKASKELLCYPKIRINNNQSLYSSEFLVKGLRRSQSLGDLKNSNSSTFEEPLCCLASAQKRLCGINSKRILSKTTGDLGSPVICAEGREISENFQLGGTLCNHNVLNACSPPTSSLQIVIDEGTDRDESNSTEHSDSSHNFKKLHIHIPKFDSNSCNSYESDTGIPNSPTLYISGVSISRSPEPRSPKSAGHKNKSCSSSLSLSIPVSDINDTVIEDSKNHLDVSTHQFIRSRSSSLIVPKVPMTLPVGATCFHLSCLSLQSAQNCSAFAPTELRVSRSASEPEKGKIVFQFPKSPTEGALSSVLHVEESNLSSDDFHEALFLGHSPHLSRRRKSKKERSKTKERKK